MTEVSGLEVFSVEVSGTEIEKTGAGVVALPDCA